MIFLEKREGSSESRERCSGIACVRVVIALDREDSRRKASRTLSKVEILVLTMGRMI